MDVVEEVKRPDTVNTFKVNEAYATLLKFERAQRKVELFRAELQNCLRHLNGAELQEYVHMTVDNLE